MVIEVLLLVALLVVLVGGFHNGGLTPFSGVGWYGGGWLGLLVVAVVILILTHRLHLE